MSPSDSSRTALTTSASIHAASSTTTVTPARPEAFQAESYQHLLHTTRLKLQDSSTINLTRMDPYNPQYQGSNTSGQSSSGSKGKTSDPGVLNGLLPRIETRGQSRGGSSKSGGQKDKGSNSYW